MTHLCSIVHRPENEKKVEKIYSLNESFSLIPYYFLLMAPLSNYLLANLKKSSVNSQVSDKSTQIR